MIIWAENEPGVASESYTRVLGGELPLLNLAVDGLVTGPDRGPKGRSGPTDELCG